MRSTLVLVLLLILGLQVSTVNAVAENLEQSRWLFKSSASECYRIPSVVSVGSTLVAVTERRLGTRNPLPEPSKATNLQDFDPRLCPDWGYIDLVARKSRDGGGSWDEQSTVVSHGTFLQPPFDMALVGNPTLVSAAGKLILLFNVSRSSGEYNGAKCSRKMRPETCGEIFSNQIWKIESHDLGVTWTSPELIDVPAKDTDMIRVGPGHGMKLSNGDLLVPGYPWMLKSADSGLTWTKAASTRDFPVRGNEMAAVETTSPGRIWALLRPTKKTAIANRDRYPFRLSAYSADYGNTYETVQIDQGFRSSLVEAGLVRYHDKIVASYPAASARQIEKGPEKETITDRRDMTLSIGSGDAKEWKHCRLTNGAAGYSDLAVAPGGLMLVYEGNISDKLKDDPRQGVLYRFVSDAFLRGCPSRE